MTDTRARLVDVTRDLVHAATYADVSVGDVCAAAGVNKGSLYHFFPSKQALGMAVLERNWELVRGLLDEAFDAEAPPLDRLDRFLAAYRAMMRAMRERFGAVPGCPLGNLASEVSAQDPQMRARLAEILAAWTERVALVVRDAQARGDVDPTLDPTAAARGVVACVQGLTVLAKADDDPAVLDTLPLLARRLLPAPPA
ncbi:TetR/AcrR family transcriptional regulator [Cellulomonas phragmiteti]|uniref:TetR family transcriptional regulator n=1 Tax=Cellulomonas phragmiteti TaxID=478780 RepID=A0ABQ4DIH9_9CELL|nr:TetR/AcrR family transcriptional regulator [Cellulomonas phragmiteti]GIG39160.1 TetR family transcriptional regulator [Cellulomonas phragmiteti]